MKRNKILITLAAVFMITLLYSPVANAAMAFYSTTLVKCGVWSDDADPNTSEIRVWLTDDGGAFTAQRMSVISTREKEMLAILLTAQTNDLYVRVRCDLNDTIPEITVMYVQETP